MSTKIELKCTRYKEWAGKEIVEQEVIVILHNEGHISDVVEAMRDFLVGMGYREKSVEDYLNFE